MAKIDIIGRWSVNKLDMLHEYLEAYTSILNTPKVRRWCRGCHYVDAFAGSVYSIEKEHDDIIEGSPLVALKTIPAFDSYVFIDINEKRLVENIEPLKKKYPEKKIETFCGDSNTILLETVLPRFSGKWNPNRGFIFLDPYGLQLQWSTVEAIAANHAYDILINFSIMGVVRQLTDTGPLEHMVPKLNAVFGSHDWHDIAYAKNEQLTLFDTMTPPVIRKNTRLVDNLIDLYRKKLKTVFEYVSDAVIMRNKTNSALYALILASHASIAIQKMHDIFRRHNK